jgi:hypothetical protein
MGLSPRFDALAVFRPAEVTLILRLLEPATLRFGFTLLAAGGLRAVALVMAIAVIGSKELLAMAALAFGGTFHRPTQRTAPTRRKARPRVARKIGVVERPRKQVRTK